MPAPRFSRSTLVVAVSALSMAAFGQDATPIDNVTIFGHSSDVADVPGSAHIVDSELWKSLSIRTSCAYCGRYLASMYRKKKDSGLRPNIGIRGSGLDRSARIALLEDGVLIAPAPYSAPSAYYFPTQRRMNSLEVLKGPASVVVGPRTTGGAINMISTPIPETSGGLADVRVGDYQTFDAHLNWGASGETVSWLIETVQSSNNGFKEIDGPVGGDTGYELQDYVAKLNVGNFRFKGGYTEQTSDETYLGLTDVDFDANPIRRYAASAGDVFDSEHEQYQLSYVFSSADTWRGEVTAYRNDFHRNWYKLQSVDGTGIDDVLTDPAYATELIS